MNQIYVTGDTHSNIERFSTEAFPEQKEMDKTDVVEILGDFGLVWEPKESKYEKYWLDWLNEKPFTTIVTLGNHENYDRIETLPIEEKFGSPAYVLRPSVFLLHSGYIYNINGKTIWNFNGASSHDIKDGIIDTENPDWKKIKKAKDKSGQMSYRCTHIDWWKQEIEQKQEVYDRGMENLYKVGNKVDFVFTHCAPQGTASILGFYEQDRLTKYLEEIHSQIKFNAWFFGHYHMNRTALPHEYCLYESIERIA